MPNGNLWKDVVLALIVLIGTPFLAGFMGFLPEILRRAFFTIGGVAISIVTILSGYLSVLAGMWINKAIFKGR